MAYEPKLIADLGFEVFTPKVIPTSASFRSGEVSYALDATLTIPLKALRLLNSFNFYEEPWPADVVSVLNRYFGWVFVIPHGMPVPEAIDKFEGEIVFRAFGLDGDRTYVRTIEGLYGRDILLKIFQLEEHFWFAQGYEQLAECEAPLLARRAVFFPIGLSEAQSEYAGSWSGGVKKVLFVCPSVIKNPYYSAAYRKFKQDFGALPHVIPGAQDVEVDDPHVVGYVSDEQLQQLYRDCAVCYYPSQEPRHVHYTPVEAAIVGMPVVFYRGSLLDRLCPGMEGGVESVDEARQAVERILAGDRDFADRLRRDQRQIAHHFSDGYCRSEWERSIAATGLLKRPAARHRSKPDAHRLPAPDDVRTPFENPVIMGSLADGIDFRAPEYPQFVWSVHGLSDREGWGRWSIGPKVTLTLWHFLEGDFELELTGGGYGRNIGARVKIRIGGAVRSIKFSKSEIEPHTVGVSFSLSKPQNIIEIYVPHPTVPEGDERAIGIGLVQMRVTRVLPQPS